MKSLACAVLLQMLALSAFASANEVTRSSDPVPGTYIATFDPETINPRTTANEVARANGVTPDHIYEHALKGFSFRAPESRALAISKNPNVSRVFEATKMYAGGSGTQVAPLPWGLDRIDQYLGTDGTFTYSGSGANVVAYVIDSGINATSDIASSRIREHRSFVTGESTITQDCSAFPHGTWVAEVLGGQTFGVAKDVTFVNYRVLQCNSTHPWASDADVAGALDAVVAAHPAEEMAVVNLSLFANTAILSVIDAAVSRVVADGVTIVTIAGNINNSSTSADACTISPAHLGASSTDNGIVTVGATALGDTVWSGSKQGSCVDLFAPGANIPVETTVSDSGTSYAAPHVAGVAAMRLERMAAYDPIWRTPQEVERYLKSNAWENLISGLSAGTPNLLLYSGTMKRRACC